jgi:DNA-binding NarL/FixJ family response regulator
MICVLPEMTKQQPKDGATKITVVIVEDDVIIRDSLIKLVDDDAGFHCLGAFATGEEALKRLPELKPQVVLMDIHLPGMSGIECTHQLKDTLPDTQILILTVYEDGENIFRALKAGASGYLLKRSDPEEVLHGLKDVFEGGAPMSGQIARKVVHSFRETPQGTNPSVKLTGQEERILALLSKGYANKEIADKTGVSMSTVRTHLRHIYEKLHVRSRTEAVLKFLK